MNDGSADVPATTVPTFALTFDAELIWGSFDHTTPDRFERQYPDVRGTIRSIIRLLDAYEVPATWAVVGHLFLDACERDPSGLAHPALTRPRQSWREGDWYDADPCTDRRRDPLWYGTDVLDAIQAARVPHEIGCHSFGHALYGDPDFTREAAVADVEACIALARERHVELRSFVFPRNLEGHHDVLREHGFVAFRGADPVPGRTYPRPIRRARHFLEHAIGTPPPVSPPVEKLPGLWDIRGSMLFMSRSGPRKAITRAARVRKARAGLTAAASRGQVFHLWTHPFNLASAPEMLLGVLEEIVAEAARMRERGEIAIATMAAVADRAAAAGVAERSARSTGHG
jgi:peptidoglycan/xylan/chitin deacetylase (PgdA/CDA1 family)